MTTCIFYIYSIFCVLLFVYSLGLFPVLRASCFFLTLFFKLNNIYWSLSSSLTLSSIFTTSAYIEVAEYNVLYPSLSLFANSIAQIRRFKHKNSLLIFSLLVFNHWEIHSKLPYCDCGFVDFFLYCCSLFVFCSLRLLYLDAYKLQIVISYWNATLIIINWSSLSLLMLSVFHSILSDINIDKSTLFWLVFAQVFFPFL